MILRGVQGRRDRACDQLLARRREAPKREEDLSLRPATSAQSSGACNAKRDRTHPPFVRPSNNTLVSSAAASSFPSTFLHRTVPPPPFPPRPSLLLPSSLHPSPPLLISSSFHLTPSVAYRSRPDLTRDLYSAQNDLRRHLDGDSRGIKDNRGSVNATSNSNSPWSWRAAFGVINRRRMARKSGRRRY